MTCKHYTARPRTAQPVPRTAAQVARAYDFPPAVTGKGYTAGVIELGGGFDPAHFPHVTAVEVAGGKNAPDGANGADGEVQLDLEVLAQVAPGAAIRCYFASNTDAGFLAAIQRAIGECDVISISWGQAEDQWSQQSLTEFDAAFKGARALGVTVLVASGDSGADDSTSAPVTDFPASSPNVIACGGTRLMLDAAGQRVTEVAWDDNDTTSATGGGVSRAFPGRQVPDIAGNADPDTGYEVTIDGRRLVIGGTSAVAPLYAGLALLLSEALGKRVGSHADLANTLLTNPGVCFDVTSGDNGAYRAGPGRDNVTGLGVVNGSKLLAVLGDSVADPAPIPAPTPPPVVAPRPTSLSRSWSAADFALLAQWANGRHTGTNKAAAAAWNRGR